MKTYFKLILWTFIVLVISFPLVLAQSETKEHEVINSIDDAKTIEDVDKYIANVQSKLKSFASISDETEKKNAAIEYYTKLGEALLKGGEKIVALTDNPVKREDGVRKKIQGLKFLQHVENNTIPKTSNYSQQLEKYFDELAKEGKYKSFVNQERYINLFSIKADKKLRENFTLEKFAQHVQKAQQWAITEGVEPVNPLLVILETAATPRALELDPDIGKKTLDEVFSFVRSDELKVSEEKKKGIISTIERFQKRFLGSNPELYGKTLDGQDFDWGKLRGKYVLVKFTASWCGPCKLEIPFMLKAYEKYHDRGFEIVSVYISDKLDATKKVVEDEKLNWIILSEELTEKAGLPKQGTTYLVAGVPTMFLTDKSGTIISTTIRGEKLEETLAKLFGEADPKNQDQKSDTTSEK